MDNDRSLWFLIVIGFIIAIVVSILLIVVTPIGLILLSLGFLGIAIYWIFTGETHPSVTFKERPAAYLLGVIMMIVCSIVTFILIFFWI